MDYNSGIPFDFCLTCYTIAGLSNFQWLSVPVLARAPKAPSDLLPSLTSLPISSLHAPYQPALFYYGFAFPQAATLFLSFNHWCPLFPLPETSSLIPLHLADACSLQSLFWTSLPQIRWIRHVPLGSLRPYACICHKIHHTLFVHMCIPLSSLCSHSLAKCLAFVGD